jgi:hypothetical protein
MKPRLLLRGEITYSVAKEEEVNILHRLKYHDERAKFFAHIADKRSWIAAVVAHHLNLTSRSSCRVADLEDWDHGSYNVCVPVAIDNWDGNRNQQPGRRVLIRFPLPYRVGEAFQPGNGDEKIRCEAATYAWMQENCPDVPIPQLYGFGTSTGETTSFNQRVWPVANKLTQVLLVYSTTKSPLFHALFPAPTPPTFVMAWTFCPFTICPPPT